MKELLDYILSSILPKGSFDVKSQKEGGHNSFGIFVDKENIGWVIGKGGKTVKAIRNILRIKAALNKETVTLEVNEKIN